MLNNLDYRVLSSIIGIIIYLAITNPDLKFSLSLASLSILIVTYFLSAFRLKEWSPAKFPEQILAKEKDRLYKKFDMDIEDSEFKKGKLKDLKYDLRQINISLK